MILALLKDPRLRAAILRAARPEEDVVFEDESIFDAVDRSFPRLVVVDSEHPHPLTGLVGRRMPDLPVLRLVPPKRTLHSSPGAAVAVTGIEEGEFRLRSLIEEASSTVWVDAVLRDLSGLVAEPLPASLVGLGRRVMEYPGLYVDLKPVSARLGVTRGALRARFRRLGLPSPSAYVRWFRLFAIEHLLREQGLTTGHVAFHVGLSSSGNLCRFVQTTADLSTSQLRDAEGRARMLVTFAKSFLAAEDLRRWEGLGLEFARLRA